MTVTDSILRGVPLFTGMTDRALEAIEELVSERSFEIDENLVTQGDPGDSFLIVRDGSASVLVDDRPVHTLAPGDFLGEISLIDGGPRTGTGRATTPLHAPALGREDVASRLG